MIYIPVRIDHYIDPDGKLNWLRNNIPAGDYRLRISRLSRTHYIGVTLKEEDATMFMLRFDLK